MEAAFGAVIVAAGNSTRIGGEKSKVLRELGGEAVLLHSLRALAKSPYVKELCVVCREQDMEEIRKLSQGIEKPVVLAKGGEERQDSVLNGVRALSPEWEYILIHDGARPLVDEKTIAAVCRGVLEHGAATAAVPAKDTYKLADEEGFVEATPPRDRLMAVQTPQGFRREMYEYAVKRAETEGKTYTDDCQLIEGAGGKVMLAQGDYKNIKLTTPEDFSAAEAFLGNREENTMRIGYGYDVHKLVEGRKLIIGGVDIPWEKGLLGHSDADVLAHAISDALLGAAALGDIGKLFPDNDPKYAGADSLKLLNYVVKAVKEASFTVGNIDATLIAQRPKIAPYIHKMRENIAAACGIDISRVSVKATTEEGLGFTGSEEGMAASAVCLIEG